MKHRAPLQSCDPNVQHTPKRRCCNPPQPVPANLLPAPQASSVHINDHGNANGIIHLHTTLGLTCFLLELLAVQHRDRESTSGLAGTVKIVQRQLNEDERLQLLNGDIILNIMVMRRLTYHRLLLFNHQPSHHFITLPHNCHNR